MLRWQGLSCNRTFDCLSSPLSSSTESGLLEFPQSPGTTPWFTIRFVLAGESRTSIPSVVLALGTVLLDLDEQNLEAIYAAIVNDAIANGQMNKDVKDELLRLLTSDHR